MSRLIIGGENTGMGDILQAGNEMRARMAMQAQQIAQQQAEAAMRMQVASQENSIRQQQAMQDNEWRKQQFAQEMAYKQQQAQAMMAQQAWENRFNQSKWQDELPLRQQDRTLKQAQIDAYSAAKIQTQADADEKLRQQQDKLEQEALNKRNTVYSNNAINDMAALNSQEKSITGLIDRATQGNYKLANINELQSTLDDIAKRKAQVNKVLEMRTSPESIPQFGSPSVLGSMSNVANYLTSNQPSPSKAVLDARMSINQQAKESADETTRQRQEALDIRRTAMEQAKLSAAAKDASKKYIDLVEKDGDVETALLTLQNSDLPDDVKAITIDEFNAQPVVKEYQGTKDRLLAEASRGVNPEALIKETENYYGIYKRYPKDAKYTYDQYVKAQKELGEEDPSVIDLKSAAQKKASIESDFGGYNNAIKFASTFSRMATKLRPELDAAYNKTKPKMTEVQAAAKQAEDLRSSPDYIKNVPSAIAHKAADEYKEYIGSASMSILGQGKGGVAANVAPPFEIVSTLAERAMLQDLLKRKGMKKGFDTNNPYNSTVGYLDLARRAFKAKYMDRADMPVITSDVSGPAINL